MDLRLTSKVAMVGGASKGLGLAVAQALAREGARVSLASRDERAIRAAAERLHAETGVPAFACAADLADAAAIERWHAGTIEEFGGVDLLFANTGGPPAGAVLDLDDAAWRAAFDLLLMSAIRLVRLVVPSMQSRGGGAILMSTSTSVREPIPSLALSNVIRASVTALAKTLAFELAPSKIRVNTILPGRIATDRLRQLDELHARRAGVPAAVEAERAQAAIPLARYGTADEFGRAAAFLLSDAASYITGASLQVDGGLIKGVS